MSTVGSALAVVPSEKMVVISEREYFGLRADKGYWKSMHTEAVKREAKLKLEVGSLRAKVRDLTKHRFGRSSERKAGKA